MKNKLNFRIDYLYKKTNEDIINQSFNEYDKNKL